MKNGTALLTGLLALLALGAGAQDRPTVFVHGLASGPDTWDGAVPELGKELAIHPFVADLDWRSRFESQAFELERELGASLPTDTIALGHSNGGLVSRQWSRIRPVGAVITLGSPNQGAPLVDHIFEWLRFLDDIFNRIDNVGAVFGHDIDQATWWWVPTVWEGVFSAAFDIWHTADSGLVSLGIDLRQPVLPQMRVASAFMAGINSPFNLDREAAQIADRGAIVNVARDFASGGPFRLMTRNYDTWHNTIIVGGIVLDVLAISIRASADVADLGAFNLADQISSVADWFWQFEETWCRAVSDPSPLFLGRCYEHDGVVPAWSQVYDIPRVPYILNLDGPTHIDETSDLVGRMHQALTTVAHVSERPVLPPDPEPSPEPPPSPDLGEPPQPVPPAPEPPPTPEPAPAPEPPPVVYPPKVPPPPAPEPPPPTPEPAPAPEPPPVVYPPKVPPPPAPEPPPPAPEPAPAPEPPPVVYPPKEPPPPAPEPPPPAPEPAPAPEPPPPAPEPAPAPEPPPVVYPPKYPPKLP